jgi:hypothetical protein
MGKITGRHGNTTFSEEVVCRICEAIATSSKGLKALCEARDDLPSWQTVMAWLNRYPDFQEQYARAKQRQMELLAEEILEICDAPAGDTVQVQKARLQVETRKWIMSKLLPKKYGERIDVSGTVDKPPLPAHVIEARLQSFIAQVMHRRAQETSNLSSGAQKLLE